MAPPKLPTFQDCHELWSKKRRRQQREQELTKPIKESGETTMPPNCNNP